MYGGRVNKEFSEAEDSVIAPLSERSCQKDRDETHVLSLAITCGFRPFCCFSTKNRTVRQDVNLKNGLTPDQTGRCARFNDNHIPFGAIWNNMETAKGERFRHRDAKGRVWLRNYWRFGIDCNCMVLNLDSIATQNQLNSFDFKK